MLYIGLVLCVLSNLCILGYKLYIGKKENIVIPIKDVCILTGISAFLQALLVWNNLSLIYCGMYIPYLLIQGYTDFKTGYVYRFTSITTCVVALIHLIIYSEHITIPILFIYGIILLFYLICSAFKKIGWGDTITVATVGLILMLFNAQQFIGMWLLIMLLASFSFSLMLMIKKKKSAPFLPYLTGSVIITLLLFNLI